MVEPMDWDAEAQEQAYYEVQRLQKRDPEAAALLMAQLVVTQEYQRKQQSQSTAIEPVNYNPIQLYAYVTRKTSWRHVDMELMDYRVFFAYVREFLQHDRREQQAMQQQYQQYQQSGIQTPQRIIDM